MAGVWLPSARSSACANAGKTTSETAYYLLSAPLTAERFNEVVGSHWGVESRLHWRLDVVMNDDQDRSCLGNGPHISLARLSTLQARPDAMETSPSAGELCALKAREKNLALAERCQIPCEPPQRAPKESG